MYRLYANDALLAEVEKPVWVRKLANGWFGLAERDNATGVMLAPQVYSLGVSEDMNELPRIRVEEFDAGEVLAQHKSDLATLAEALCEADETDADWRAEMEAAMCDAEEADADWKQQIEAALCELEEERSNRE